MVRLLTITLLVVLTSMFGQSQTPSPTPTTSGYVPERYSLVMEDVFDQKGMDKSKWDYRYKDGKKYFEGYATDASVIQPNDGFLYLTTTYNDDKFHIGMIQSHNLYKYGYFEARIQFQSLQGHHGAFWLQSPLFGKYPNDPAQSGAEIDIAEFFGNGRKAADVQQNVYWNAYDSPDFQKRSNNIYYKKENGVELSNDFHIFSLLWTQDEYVFSIDGKETWRISDGVSQTDEYLVLSLITRDWEAQRLRDNRDKLPDGMRIDYVRIYQK